MSDLYEQIVGQRGSIENLIARIPGFRGYQDKGARRTADRMVREYITGQLSSRIERLKDIELRVLESGGIGRMSETRSVKDRLQMYRDRVAAAAPGYAGLMDAIKVDDEALERLYAFDEAQVRYLEHLDPALAALEQAAQGGGDISAALHEVDQIAREANDAFRLREDVLINLDKALGGSAGSR
jgi:hypothetical protein